MHDVPGKEVDAPRHYFDGNRMKQLKLEIEKQ